MIEIDSYSHSHGWKKGIFCIDLVSLIGARSEKRVHFRQIQVYACMCADVFKFPWVCTNRVSWVWEVWKRLGDLFLFISVNVLPSIRYVLFDGMRFLEYYTIYIIDWFSVMAVFLCAAAIIDESCCYEKHFDCLNWIGLAWFGLVYSPIEATDYLGNFITNKPIYFKMVVCVRSKIRATRVWHRNIADMDVCVCLLACALLCSALYWYC